MAGSDPKDALGLVERAAALLGVLLGGGDDIGTGGGRGSDIRGGADTDAGDIDARHIDARHTDAGGKQVGVKRNRS